MVTMVGPPGGLDSAIRRMRALMEQGRASALGIKTA